MEETIILKSQLLGGSVDGSLDVTKRVLRLRGKCLDVVKTVYQDSAHEFRTIDARLEEVVADDGNLPNQASKELLDFQDHCWEPASSLGLYPNGEVLRDAYWRTLVFGSTDLVSNENFNIYGLRVPKSVHDQPGLTVVERTVRVAERISIFEPRFQDLPCRRRFAITEGGYMGWAPRAALDGDLVCGFNGSTIPFMIRPKPDGTNTILGGCCMPGLMNGAAFELKDKPEVNISLS